MIWSKFLTSIWAPISTFVHQGACTRSFPGAFIFWKFFDSKSGRGRGRWREEEREKQAEQKEQPGLGSWGLGSQSLRSHQSCSIHVGGVAGPRPEASCGEGGIVSGSRNREERMQSFQKAVNKSSALAGCPEVLQPSSQLSKGLNNMSEPTREGSSSSHCAPEHAQ